MGQSGADLATLLTELADYGLIALDEDAEGRLHCALTDVGEPVARQMAMSHDDYATVLLGVLVASMEHEN